MRWSRDEGALVHAPKLARADQLFDSSNVPHDSRWSLPYPPWHELRAYMDATLDATLQALERTPEDERYFFALALLHEDMHGEALLMTLQSLELAPPALELPQLMPMAAKSRDIEFSGGDFLQGTARDESGFVFDNEKWAHPRRVAPFAIASHPVTHGEYLAFVAERPIHRPAHWREVGGSWQVRRFDRWHPLQADAPMVHVTLDDAQAYCAWARRRLPTETEWEFAARHDRAALKAVGSVWEWTSSAFAPYPGFAPDPYKDYSEPWFHTHFVLRGGSSVTRSRLAHERFRNFYLPQRSDAFAGLRTCAVE